MTLRFDIFNFWNAVLAIGIMISAVTFLLYSQRKGIVEINKSNAEGWKSAAELRQSEIDTIKTRFNELKDDYKGLQEQMRTLQQEYHKILQLNVSLQLEKQQWANEKSELYRRLSDVEKNNKG